MAARLAARLAAGAIARVSGVRLVSVRRMRRKVQVWLSPT